jgi:hypothetical protein
MKTPTYKEQIKKLKADNTVLQMKLDNAIEFRQKDYETYRNRENQLIQFNDLANSKMTVIKSHLEFAEQVALNLSIKDHSLPTVRPAVFEDR